ncbi:MULTISPECIES: hypothetical protein [Nostoc]|uniref:Uncharacterized protein n=1 Tax=Nostoc paludosum FACHB-159 TaxID=2692908 RepID=A0ABR8K1V7_9NOSO|nr:MULTISPECIES: hypothetical protein [Nostoc]MBD2676126.1 hypothetical protein [Nostoc sp. FACHB-857]MBD2732744.1 hypothetical protein [Nostoc paludosum FACHB-159]
MSNLSNQNLPAENKNSSLPKESFAVKNQHYPRENYQLVRPFVGIRQYTNQLSPKLANPGYVKRARQIYERLCTELGNNYSSWYIAIESDSGDYFINANKALAQQQAKQKHPSRLICTFQLISQEHR